MKFITILFIATVLVGCQSPCFLCEIPGSVTTSMQGQVGNLRIIEDNLIDGLENEELKEIWKIRLAAFITESRSTLAWAKREDFDTAAVLEEERKD